MCDCVTPTCAALAVAELAQVYRVTVEPLVHTLFNNGKATCFAYGQTGSGKTFTMSPLPIRAAADILRYLERPELRDVELYVSCFEIYGNKVFDLLNMRKKLNILEDGKKKVCVVGLKVSTHLMLMITMGHNMAAAPARLCRVYDGQFGGRLCSHACVHNQ
jgi:hypothetical protein